MTIMVTLCIASYHHRLVSVIATHPPARAVNLKKLH